MEPAGESPIRYSGGDKSFVVWHRDDPTLRRVFPARDAKGEISPVYLVVRWLAQRNATEVLGAFLEPMVAEELRKECQAYVTQQNIRDWQDVGPAVLEILQRFVHAQAGAKAAARAKARQRAGEPRIAPRHIHLGED